MNTAETDGAGVSGFSPVDGDRGPVVVTGAASGIGAALAARLRRSSVAVIGVDRRSGDGILACDLSDPGEIASLAGDLPPVVAGLAHVAGVPGTASPEVVLAVNSLAPRLLTGHLVDRMSAGAAVVTVASVAAHRDTQPPEALAALTACQDRSDVRKWLADHPIDGSAAYDTSKRVLVDWTAAESARLLRRGVRCLSVSPGPVQTPILGDFVATMGQEAIDRSAAAVGRHATADEIAAVVAFALSPDAAWCNGIDIVADGGLLAARSAASTARSGG